MRYLEMYIRESDLDKLENIFSSPAIFPRLLKS